MSDQLIVNPKAEEQIRPSWQAEWFRKLEDKWNPPFEIANIQFHYHYEDFFNRNISIRAARDWQNHPFWFYIAFLFFAGQLAFAGIGISFKVVIIPTLISSLYSTVTTVKIIDDSPLLKYIIV